MNAYSSRYCDKKKPGLIIPCVAEAPRPLKWCGFKGVLVGLEFAAVYDVTDDGRPTKGASFSNRLLVLDFVDVDRSGSKAAGSACPLNACSSRYCDSQRMPGLSILPFLSSTPAEGMWRLID